MHTLLHNINYTNNANNVDIAKKNLLQKIYIEVTKKIENKLIYEEGNGFRNPGYKLVRLKPLSLSPLFQKFWFSLVTDSEAKKKFAFFKTYPRERKRERENFPVSLNSHNLPYTRLRRLGRGWAGRGRENGLKWAVFAGALKY